jgi:hypothetical protein
MKKHSLFAITGLSLVALLIGLFASVTLVAAQTTSGNGSGVALEIAPPVMNLTANPGQTITTHISLRDVSSGNLIVNGQINDFVSGDENGTPKIILDENETNPYSIKDWISPLPELTLKPKQIENLPVTITVPANASPGGYYGVVRFTGTPPELKGTGVSLTGSLGALILLKVNGDVKESLAAQEFSVNKNGKSGTLFESAPLNFVERIKDNGNIHEQPTGQVTITDMFGKKIAAVNVNLELHNVLPGSIRKFTQPFDSSVIGNRILFGRYHADMKVTYGANKQVLASSLEFWVIPYTLIAAIILALVGGFIALRFAIIRYNRYIISKAQKPRRK